MSLSGKWLKEAGFDAGRGVTVSIAGDCIVPIPDNDEVYELRTQIKQVKRIYTLNNSSCRKAASEQIPRSLLR
ncbi:SymE family type I addiction module toxin [Klebsiella sp. MISC125]|uniref:SymE family type I addiction module toxin n=1 Tax=Klebsiella sp. MISC125 TaxID=2755386 RepID=UPI003DA8F655